MAYIVIKTIKGRQYQYRQRSYREGGRVRTESIYLGPVAALRSLVRNVADFIEVNRTRGPVIDEEAMLQQAAERSARDAQKHAAALNELHNQFGLTLGDPSPAEAA